MTKHEQFETPPCPFCGESAIIIDGVLICDDCGYRERITSIDREAMIMSEKTQLTKQILAIANVTRKCVLIGNEKIAKAVEESPLDELDVNGVIQFSKRFMQGPEKDVIIGEFQISPEVEKKLDKYELAW